MHDKDKINQLAKQFKDGIDAFDEEECKEGEWNKFNNAWSKLHEDLKKMYSETTQHEGSVVYNKVMEFYLNHAHLLQEAKLIPGESESSISVISNIFGIMNVTPKDGRTAFGPGGIQTEILEFRDKNGYGFAHKLFEAGRIDVIFVHNDCKFPIGKKGKDGLDAFLKTGTSKAPHPYTLIKKEDTEQFANYLGAYEGITTQQAKADIQKYQNQKMNRDGALHSISVKSNDNSFLSSIYHGICEPVYNFIKEKWNSLTELIGRLFKDGGKER